MNQPPVIPILGAGRAGLWWQRFPSLTTGCTSWFMKLGNWSGDGSGVISRRRRIRRIRLMSWNGRRPSDSRMNFERCYALRERHSLSVIVQTGGQFDPRFLFAVRGLSEDLPGQRGWFVGDQRRLVGAASSPGRLILAVPTTNARRPATRMFTDRDTGLKEATEVAHPKYGHDGRILGSETGVHSTLEV